MREQRLDRPEEKNGSCAANAAMYRWLINLPTDNGMSDSANSPEQFEPDGDYSWFRLTIAMMLATVGGVGLWSGVVALPAIEAEFGVDRGTASLPYTATMFGFAFGQVMMGKLADRYGVQVPLIIGACMLGVGYIASSFAQTLWQFILAQAFLIGLLGSSSTFGPLVADISHWFFRRRGIAVAVVASGNYLAGTIWPPIIQLGIEAGGW